MKKILIALLIETKKNCKFKDSTITDQAKAKENSASSSCYFTAAVDHHVVIHLYTTNHVLFSNRSCLTLRFITTKNLSLCRQRDEEYFDADVNFVREKEVKDACPDS
ncbi:Uncharacterized protein Rs2_33927 [Raphanus sativus]|nr:Uncharacterized protein Rs2_33927 [Raphanus sativus]